MGTRGCNVRRTPACDARRRSWGIRANACCGDGCVNGKSEQVEIAMLGTTICGRSARARTQRAHTTRACARTRTDTPARTHTRTHARTRNARNANEHAHARSFGLDGAAAPSRRRADGGSKSPPRGAAGRRAGGLGGINRAARLYLYRHGAGRAGRSALIAIGLLVPIIGLMVLPASLRTRISWEFRKGTTDPPSGAPNAPTRA